MANASTWTVQSSAPLDQSDVFPEHPGQVITADQLPDPAVQEAAGISSEQWKRNAGHLYVDSNHSLLSEDLKGAPEKPAVKPRTAKAAKAE